MDKRSVQSEMSSYIGKLLRDHFGKGPASVFVSLQEPYITVYLKNFLAPMERVLVGQKNHTKVEETRDLMMDELIPEIKATFRASAGINIESLYYDWSLTNRSGVLIGTVADEQLENDDITAYDHQKAVHEEIESMSRKAEKTPVSITSYMLNDRTLLVERNGILVAIEKEMIQAGYEHPLKISKRRLEKRLINLNSIESILGKTVEEFFVDWDFDKDRSFMVFILRP